MKACNSEAILKYKLFYEQEEKGPEQEVSTTENLYCFQKSEQLYNSESTIHLKLYISIGLLLRPTERDPFIQNRTVPYSRISNNPLTGGYSESPDAFRLFFKNCNCYRLEAYVGFATTGKNDLSGAI